jgi:uncharacterized membrane protein YkoI
MKAKHLVGIAMAAALAAGCATEDQGHTNRNDQAKLQAEAKISQEAATQTALGQVPNGTVKELELEREHGKLIWSFDMATPGTTEITEVNVDAITGKVVGTSKESPKGESTEKN